ncbi:hypothetical protein AXG93_48s1180 [Marchantia polymorpha subsp. ruderalis]|uniref:PHD-type domain-containing protein n=1 Tax=Marchantia polymorpha subsp. ruderalis TaxID=1480154 RepID=A0A176VVD7_MARPO|nr:hypothetical protein AXG93_48s1180 [Marchantia polymorpha subsp. ruderalis]
MEDSYGNYSVGSIGGRDIASPVVYAHPGEPGGRGDSGSRGSHGNHRGYRRGGSYQRGRNFVDNRPNSHEHPQFANARRHVGGHGGGFDSIPDSPQSGDSFIGEREGRGRGVTGPLRFNSNNFRGGRTVSQDNPQDYRSYASGESSFDGNRERWSVSEAAPAGDSRSDDQLDVHRENQDHRISEQQRRFAESNRFGGSRRGSGAGRGQRFNRRGSSDGSHAPQTSRRGGTSYHEVEDGRRLDRGSRGRHDENREIVVANYTNHSEDSEHGSVGLLAHLEQEIPQASSTTSNNYNRDGNWPEFFGEVEYDSRPGSSSSDNVPFRENAGRVYVGDSGGGRGRRESYRENRKADGPSVIQGHRRDNHQITGRKKAVFQADNGEALWRAKKSEVPQLVQELEERLTRGTIECMICYDMVGRSSPMWSCGSCYAIFHLNCIKRWARAPTSTDLSVSSANHSLEGNWRCPGCQAVELITARDLRYNCFCGQVDNPPVDHYLTPHSCGGPCKKPLDRNVANKKLLAVVETFVGESCHVDVILVPGFVTKDLEKCHPGPCGECEVSPAMLQTCPCGKKKLLELVGSGRPRINCTDPVPTCGQGGSSTSRASAETEMILSRLPAPLQPIAQSSERTPLGQRKLSCDDECGKLEKKRLLADAFGVELSGDFTSGDTGALGSEMLSEMLRRDPQWVLAVEERFKFLLLGPKVSTLKVHVFCPMAKEKREVIYQLAERWSLSVSSAGREPRRFPIVHVTNKSKVPYTRMLSKSQLPPAGQQTPPAFNAAVDMEPGLVVAFFDVPREVDMSGLVLRFAGECELVWLNDKNALAIFGDVARAATALRRVDHTTAYKGAISVPGSAVYTSSKGAWGQAAGSSFATKPSAKKKAVQESSWVEDAWGDDNRKSSKEQLTGAWQRKEPSIITKNPWGALEQTRARVSDARLKGCYVSSQPSGTSQASTKEGESSAQGERTKPVKSTTKERGDQAGPSGASKEVSNCATVITKSPADDSLVPQNGEKDDWERLLD